MVPYLFHCFRLVSCAVLVRPWLPSVLPCLCRLLITFANSFDPDQARHNVRPDLDPNCLTIWISEGIPERIFRKFCFEKKTADDKKACKNYPVGKEFVSVFQASQLCSAAKTLAPFSLALSLSLARIHRFEEQVYIICYRVLTGLKST